MSGNKFGSLFQLTTFGESHGEAIGGIIEGCPSGIALDMKAIQLDLNRRKPGQSAIVTQRKEPDEVKFLSGIFEGKTTGYQLDLPFLIPIKNPETTTISRINIDLLMRIRYMMRNMVLEIIVVVEEVPLERPPVE